MTDPAPRPLPHPGPPPTPAVIAAMQARYDAAIELQAAINSTHELASAGRSSEPVHQRQVQAERVWDRLNGRERPATHRQLERLVADTFGGEGGTR